MVSRWLAFHLNVTIHATAHSGASSAYRMYKSDDGHSRRLDGWVRKRTRWMRDGGRDTRRAPTTMADWAAKWSGLFRPRNERVRPSGYEAHGWAMTTWPTMGPIAHA